MNAELFLADVLSAPERLARTLDGYSSAGGPLDQVPAGRSFERVVLIGMGSSRYAALTAAAELRAGGTPAWAEYASTAVPTPPSAGTLAVGISASGETAETVAALARHAGVSTTAAVTNAPGSAIAAAADIVLPVLSGPEPGGVACVSFQATLAVLLLLAARIRGAAPPDLRPAVQLAASLRDGREDWLDAAAGLIDAADVVQTVAPAQRISSALQSALMLREGPRLNAAGAETGDWLHVDVYLTKRPGYRTLLFQGSRFDDGVIEWARSRSSPVIAVGGPLAGADVEIPLPPASEPVTALVETGVAELLAARVWLDRPGG
jgi:fructoselysine-6-P-deglycase FrlB-like protein